MAERTLGVREEEGGHRWDPECLEIKGNDDGHETLGRGRVRKRPRSMGGQWIE